MPCSEDMRSGGCRILTEENAPASRRLDRDWGMQKKGPVEGPFIHFGSGGLLSTLSSIGAQRWISRPEISRYSQQTESCAL